MAKMVKITVKKSGLYGKDGAIPVGTQMVVNSDKIPNGWLNKIDIGKEVKDTDQTMVVNPASSTAAAQATAAKEAQAAADKKAAEEKAEADKKAAAAKTSEK